MRSDSLEIHHWITNRTTVHSFVEHTLKLTIHQKVIIFSHMFWKILIRIIHIMVRMKRLVWHLDPTLPWLLLKVLMAQEGDRVPAVEGQVCLVRWVSCGDGKGQINISEKVTGTHTLITMLSIVVHLAKSGENDKEGVQKDRYHPCQCGQRYQVQSKSLFAKYMHLSSIKGNMTTVS